MAQDEVPLIRVLTIQVDDTWTFLLERLLKPDQIVSRPYNVEKLMEEVLDPPPVMVLCGQAPANIPLTELGQMLRMQYQDALIYYITTDRANLDKKTYQKNGFTDVFLMPPDETFLAKLIEDDLAKISKGAIKAFRSVKLLDIQPGVKLDFDTTIYLPMNKKYVKYSAAGEELDPERAERLQKHKVSSIYVPSDQMKEFYKFTASQLKKMGESTAMSETEKREKMQGAIRDLMGGMFSQSTKDATTDAGRRIVQDCQEIVKAFVSESNKTNGGWYERIVALTGSKADSYSHAANVSTFAAMFAMGTGIGNPSDLALAGILHDIGLADVPAKIQKMPEELRTPAEQELYKKHPQGSIDMIKNRKMVVPEVVQKIIMQHHERICGTGFPKGLQGSKVLPEAQLLSMADNFDYLTAVVDGQRAMNPIQALQHLKKYASGNSSTDWYDPNIMNKVLSLFPAE